MKGGMKRRKKEEKGIRKDIARFKGLQEESLL